MPGDVEVNKMSNADRKEEERCRRIIARHDCQIRQRDKLKAKFAFIRSAVGLRGSPIGPPILPDTLILNAVDAGNSNYHILYLRTDSGDGEGLNADQPADDIRNSKYLATGSLTADPVWVRATLQEARDYWAALREQLKPKRDKWSFLNYLSRGK